MRGEPILPGQFWYLAKRYSNSQWFYWSHWVFAVCEGRWWGRTIMWWPIDYSESLDNSEFSYEIYEEWTWRDISDFDDCRLMK